MAIAPWQRLRLRRASALVADTLFTAGTNIVLAVLGLASGILAARLLGPHGRGELAAIQTWPSVVATLAMLGMPEATVYYTARDHSAAGRYLGSGILVALISSIPFMLMAYLAMPLLLHAQAPAIVWAGRWYLLLVLIYALVGMMLHPLRGRSDFAHWNALRLGPNVLWISVLGVAWAFSLATPTFVAAGNLVALALLLFPFGLLVTRRVPGPFTPDLQKLPPMLHYGLPCMMTGVPQMLNLRLDQMLMAALLPPHLLGLYVVAVAWSGAAAPLLSAVGAVTTPAVASAADRAQGARRMAAAARGTAVLALVLCMALAVLTPFAIVILFGEGFRASISAALVLLPAAGVLGFSFVLQEGLRGLGRPYAVLKAELTGLVVTGLALAAMLRPMGIIGAAIASLLGYSTTMASLLFCIQRYAGVPATALLLPRSEEIQLVLAHLARFARMLRVSTTG